jgi:hypothetical protein
MLEVAVGWRDACSVERRGVSLHDEGEGDCEPGAVDPDRQLHSDGREVKGDASVHVGVAVKQQRACIYSTKGDQSLASRRGPLDTCVVNNTVKSSMRNQEGT